MRAGVIPALSRSGHRWESFIVRPGRQPLAALVNVLSEVMRAPDAAAYANNSAAIWQAAGVDELRRHPGMLGAALRDRVSGAAAGPYCSWTSSRSYTPWAPTARLPRLGPELLADTYRNTG